MLRIKFILIGDSGVGKTCIINQYTNQEFKEEHITTITAGGDKQFKEIKVGNKQVKLEIWDTAGQEQYRAVNKIFMNKAKIAAIVYDMTNQKSFDNLKNWYNELKDKSDSVELIGIIANKSDLYEEQVINKDEGENYAKSINALFFETSAMDYESVAAVFEGLTKKYVEMEEEKERIKKEEELKSQKKVEKKKEEQEKKGVPLDRSKHTDGGDGSEGKGDGGKGCCG